jgi:hypothetical protein
LYGLIDVLRVDVKVEEVEFVALLFLALYGWTMPFTTSGLRLY